VLEGEECAGAAESGLNLVGEQERSVPRGDLAQLSEIALGRNHDPGLALDRFDEHRHRAVGHRRGDGVGIAERQQSIAAGERAEALAILLARGEADDRRRAAVEVVVENQDLRLFGGNSLDRLPPFARQLDRGLDRLGATVHRQEAIETGESADLLAQPAELVVAEGARTQGQALRLFGERLDQAGMAMSLIDRRVGGEEVQIAVPFDVPDPDAFAAGDDDLERMIVVRAVLFFERDQVLRGERGGGGESVGHLELRKTAMSRNSIGIG
jgi:hypothetical protein